MGTVARVSTRRERRQLGRRIAGLSAQVRDHGTQLGGVQAEQVRTTKRINDRTEISNTRMDAIELDVRRLAEDFDRYRRRASASIVLLAGGFIGLAVYVLG